MAYSDIVNDDTMISPTIIVYYKYKGDFFNILENDNLFHFYYSLKRENNLLDTISFRASSRLLTYPPSSPQRLLNSFWSQNTEKRNNTISQMRLRSVFKMRTSILNTATTEQMGYGIISFFVCFPLMNQIVKLNIVIFFSLLDEEGDSYA